MKTPMKRTVSILFAFLLVAVSTASADEPTQAVQQTLKDQGFYYGEVTGKVNDATTAAIRRYQIRNGLKITGEVDKETAKSLGLAAGQSAKVTPRPQAPAAPTAAPDVADLREDPSPAPRTAVVPPLSAAAPYPGYAPGPRGLQPEMSGIFDGTPFEVAPPEVQRRAILGAQTLLARRGFYRSGIDGVYGPGMQFALRAYQTRAGIEPTGILDLDTLASLGLLPGQRAPGFGPRQRRVRVPRELAPDGERIYDPD